MAEPDAPQFSDRSTPEPLGDLTLQAPLLVAPPLGINRQFLVPLGARSLTVLEPDLFQSRSSQVNSSLFEDSPFFNDPLLTVASKPVVQTLPSAVEGFTSNTGSALQRSPIPLAPEAQHQLDPLLELHSSASSLAAVNQLDESLAPESSIQRSHSTNELQANTANGFSNFLQEAPEQTIARSEFGHYAPLTPPETSSTTIETIKGLSLQSPLTPKNLEGAATIEAMNAPTPLPAYEVQRSTPSEVKPELISELGAPAINSQPEPISETIASSVVNLEPDSTAETITELQAELKPDSQFESTLDFKSASASSPDYSISEPVSVAESDAKNESRLTKTAALISNTGLEAVPGLQSQSIVTSTGKNSNLIEVIEDQATAFSQASASEATPTLSQKNLPSQPFSAATAPLSQHSESIARQQAQEHQSVALPEQQEFPLNSVVQRSSNDGESTFVPSKEPVQNAARKPEAEIAHSAIETLATNRPPFSFTASGSDTASDSESASIANQAASSISSASPLLQAKELELPSQAIINASASEVHSASSTPSTAPLEQPNQFIAEPLALAELEAQTSLDNFEQAYRPLQEPSTANSSTNQTAVTNQLQSSSAVSAATSDNSNAAIDAQTPPQPSPAPSQFLQAKELSPPPHSSTDVLASGLHSVSKGPCASQLEQANQSTAETPALEGLMLEAKLQVESEPTSQDAQAPLDPNLFSSTEVILPAQVTSSPQSDTLQASQATPQSETTSLIARSLTQPNAEAISQIQAQHESLLKSPPHIPTRPVQLDLQPKSTEAISEIVSADTSSLKAFSHQGVEQKVDAFDHETSQSPVPNNQILPLAEQSQDSEHSSTTSLTAKPLENAQVTPEAFIQRTAITPLESSVSSTESTELNVSEPQSFNSQSLNLKSFHSPNLVPTSYPSGSNISEAEAPELALQDQIFGNLEDQEASATSTSVPDKAPNSEVFLKSPSIDQSLNLAQASLVDSALSNPELDLYSTSTSQSEFNLIQEKNLVTNQGDTSESGVSEDVSAFGVTSTSAIDGKEPSVEIQLAAKPSSVLPGKLQGNFSPSSYLAVESSEVENLEIQSPEIQSLETQSLNIQRSETQSLDAQSLELLSTPGATDQPSLLSIQTSIDPSATEKIEASDTIACTSDEKSQRIHSSESTINSANTGVHFTHSAINPIAGNLGADSHQNVAQNSTSSAVALTLDTISNQGAVQKRDEFRTPLQLVNPLTQETLQKSPDTVAASASQAWLSNQPEPEQALVEVEAEQSLPALVNSEDIVSSSHSAIAQRSHEASTAASNTTFDTTTLNTAATDLTQLSSPQVQRLPEDQPLPEVQRLVQPVSDAAIVQPRSITQAPTPSEIETELAGASDIASSIAPTNELLSTESIAQLPPTTREPISPSTTVMRSLESSLPEPPSTPEVSSVLPLASIHPEHQATRIEQSVGPFLSSPVLSEQQNTSDRHLSSESNATPPTGEANSGEGLPSTTNVTIADSPTISLQQKAEQTDGRVQKRPAEPLTSNPSFMVESPIQEQVTPHVEAAIQPLATDPLEEQHSKSSTSPSEPAETHDLTVQPPHTSEPNLTQSAKTDLPQSQQNSLLPTPSSERRALQNLEGPTTTELSSQHLSRKIVPVDITQEPGQSAIVQRTPSARARQTSALHAFNTVDDETLQLEAPAETTVHSSTGNVTTAESGIASEVSSALPLVLQKLSTLEPIASSANWFERASAAPPMVQASPATTQQPDPTPIAEVPLQSNQTVKVDRPTTQWSDFSSLVQRQTTPSARSSSRSIAEQVIAPHSVANVLASTGETVQRQENQPAEVRISRDAQPQAAATIEAVDAKDLEQLAQVIYQQLRQRLRVEQERHGRAGAGRLPW